MAVTPNPSTSLRLNKPPKKIKKLYIYRKYQLFLATPPQLREKEYGYIDQKGFSKANNVSERQLVTWKKIENFWDEVGKAMDFYLKQYTPAVRGAMLNKILANGDAAEVKLWHQLIEGWSEKIDNNITHNIKTLQQIQDTNKAIFEMAKKKEQKENKK